MKNTKQLTMPVNISVNCNDRPKGGAFRMQATCFNTVQNVRDCPRGLLERLGALSGCDSLSDLHSSPRLNRDLLAKQIQRLAPQGYPLGEWAEAACYITRVERTFECVDDAVEFLLRYLR